MFDLVASLLLFVIGFVTSSLNCILWELLETIDPLRNPYVDHYHWSITAFSTGIFLTVFKETTIAFLFLGFSLPLMIYENDLNNPNKLRKMIKPTPLYIMLGYSIAAFTHWTLLHLHIPTKTIIIGTIILTLTTTPITFTIAAKNNPYNLQLKQIEQKLITETTLLNRYFWLYYIIAVCYLIIYTLFWIYDAFFWRTGIWYGLSAIFLVFFIYALQRKQTERELKKITEIFKPTEENISLLLNIVFMTVITTMIFVSLMVIPGIEKSAIQTVSPERAVILEISPATRIRLEAWVWDILGQFFIIGFSEEIIAGFLVAIGYKIGGPKGIAIAQIAGQFWVLLHILYVFDPVYIICLGILRAIIITLYFIPIKIGNTKFRENLLSAIISHGINNAISIAFTYNLI